LYKAKKYETTCILHESFSSMLENDLMIVRPNLQCESPYFHGLWYFDLSAFFPISPKLSSPRISNTTLVNGPSHYEPPLEFNALVHPNAWADIGKRKFSCMNIRLIYLT
jgi:hypothetical protein